MKAQHMNKQHGAALIVSLVILIVMTIIGLSAIRTSSMEEKMAANTRDQQVAMQATEMALRAGEAWIASQSTEPEATDNGSDNVWVANSTGSNGLLPNDDVAESWWQQRDAVWWNNNGIQAGSDVVFSTNEADIDVNRPRYIIEYQQYVSDDLLIGTGSTTTGRSFYRVTARGTGASEQSRIMLQSTTAKRY